MICLGRGLEIQCESWMRDQRERVERNHQRDGKLSACADDGSDGQTVGEAQTVCYHQATP